MKLTLGVFTGAIKALHAKLLLIAILPLLAVDCLANVVTGGSIHDLTGSSP